MTERSEVAPDMVIVGAARSGTSFLGATLARPPMIDGGRVKEPDYFSSRWDDGPDRYERLFHPRQAGLKRLDASVSYTYPQHPLALQRIRETAPNVHIVYTVRDPLARLVSHYQIFRYYYGRADKWPDLGAAIETSQMFLGSGDYGHWLDRLRGLYSVEQLLVVPFPVMTSDISQPMSLILSHLGLPEPDAPLAATAFRNEPRSFRSPAVRAAHRMLHRSSFYPALRSTLGADRLRKVRGKVTKEVLLPTLQEELMTLTESQRERVDRRAANSQQAVTRWLQEQDARLGLAWSDVWSAHVAPEPDTVQE